VHLSEVGYMLEWKTLNECVPRSLVLVAKQSLNPQVEKQQVAQYLGTYDFTTSSTVQGPSCIGAQGLFAVYIL
jgi:hypothetical protein